MPFFEVAIVGVVDFLPSFVIPFVNGAAFTLGEADDVGDGNDGSGEAWVLSLISLLIRIL